MSETTRLPREGQPSFMNWSQQAAEIKEFQWVMLQELEDNMWKGGWHENTPAQLVARVYEELTEVQDELSKLGSPAEDLERLYSECADVANMAAMVASCVKMMILRGAHASAFKHGGLDPEARIFSIEEAVAIGGTSQARPDGDFPTAG